MTRKDYIAIAAVLRRHGFHLDRPPGFREGCEWQRRAIAHALCEILAADNDRFDADKFLAACDVPTLEGVTAQAPM